MRLDDFDPNINVEDQRGQNFGGGGFGGGGGNLIFALLPFVFSRFGCGGVVVLLLVLAVFGGGLPMLGGGGGSGGLQVGPRVGQIGSDGTGPLGQQGETTKQKCLVNDTSHAACNAFSSADTTWQHVFGQSGERFRAPKLVFYDGTGRSGCGLAQSAMGPFYCPVDQGVYLDTSFFDELASRFGAKGDFAQDYVIAHESGHHIQNLPGTSGQVQREPQRLGEAAGNALSVRLELQADCYAGVWAGLNRDRMEPGDLEEGMTAAHAIGDDTLQREAQGRVVPDSFTHGTSEQRMKWLRRGLDTADPNQCDTFSGAI